jgi:hypothetical protein
MNGVEEGRAFDISVTGLSGIHVWGGAIVGMPAATSRSVPIQVRVPAEGVPPGSHPIEFQLRAIGVEGVEVREASVFIVR